MIYVDEIKKLLDQFQSSVEKDLNEIHKSKAALIQMMSELHDNQNRGRFVRDNHRIVLSAPEIVIGNVDANGNIMGNSSSIVIIRANHIGMNGVGEGGNISQCAPYISQIAVDPGIDGHESVVGPISTIVSHARNITIQSDNPKDTFATTVDIMPPGGICIKAENQVVIEANQQCEIKKEYLENRIKVLEKTKSSIKSDSEKSKKKFEQAISDLDKLKKESDLLRANADVIRGKTSDLQELVDLIQEKTNIITQTVSVYANQLSSLAETNRQLSSLKEEKSKLKSEDDFKTKSNQTSIDIRSENISLSSADGDGNLREDTDSGIDVIANRVDVRARDKDQKLGDKSSLTINAKTIEISTVNTVMQDDGTSGEAKAEGDVIIKSKTITMEAIDNEIKDNKPTEKALTKDSVVSIRAEKMDLSATDTEGKATGSIKLNSKVIQARAMDVDKEKRTDKELAKDSQMLLVAEKMFVGARDKQVKSKKLQAMSEEIGLFADKTLEAQQGEKKAVMQLADGNAALSGSKTQLYGETTINAKTEVKGELKAPKATIDSVEAKSAFKSPNISDGMGAGAGGGGGSLSAKLTAEDGPKE